MLQPIAMMTTSLTVDAGATSCEPMEAEHMDGMLDDIDPEQSENIETDERGSMLSTQAGSRSQPPPHRQDCGPQAAVHTGSYNEDIGPVDQCTHYSLPPHIRQESESGEERQALLSQLPSSHESNTTSPSGSVATATTPMLIQTSSTSGIDSGAPTHNTCRSDCPSPHTPLSCGSTQHPTNSQSRSQGNTYELSSVPQSCQDTSLDTTPSLGEPVKC